MNIFTSYDPLVLLGRLLFERYDHVNIYLEAVLAGTVQESLILTFLLVEQWERNGLLPGM